MKYKSIFLRLRNFFDLVKNDFKAKYAGNFLGVLWAFIYPCVTVILYWFVFRILLNTEAEEGEPYILWLVSALVPFLFVCDAVPAAAGVFVDYSYLVKKVKFGIGVLPFVRVMSNFIIHAFFIFLMLVMSFALGYFPNLGDLWLLYYIAAELAFVLAVGTLLSVLTVFVRDIRGALSVLIQVGYWLTPLFWNISAADPRIGVIIKLINPTAYLTEGFRCAVLYGSAPERWYTVYFWLLILAVSGISAWLYKRLRGVLGDYV